MLSSDVSATCMFFMGMFIGIILDNAFKVYLKAYPAHSPLYAGTVQILVNSFIIRNIKTNIQDLGLFTLGLLTFQNLIIKKLV